MTGIEQEQASNAAGKKDQHQYLTFTLGDEEYGIEILRVQEIKGYSAVTSVAGAPPWIKGVMNLRGAVVPVVDLRVKFGIGVPKYDRFTVVIMVMVGARVVGAVVDGVSDVMSVSAADWGPPPEMGADVDTSFLTGIARQGDRLISLLEIERVVGMGAELEEALAA